MLRPLTMADAEAHHAGEDWAQIAAFEFPGPSPLENVFDAIDRWQRSWALRGPVRNFGIWNAHGDVLIGNLELRADPDGTVNLSYVVFPSFRRRGIATSACRVALAYAATALRATTARIRLLDWNEASAAVARSLGAHQIGTERSGSGGRFVVYELAINPEH